MRNHLILGAVGAIFLTASALAISPPRQAPPREDTQPGLGALAPFVNVKGSPYFAVGDGATDDTTAIGAAITAAGGGLVLLPAGTYKITSGLTLTGGVSLRGVGGRSGGTVLSYTGSGVAVTISSNGAKLIGIKVSTTSSATDGIFISDALHVLVEDVYVTGTPTRGIHMGSTASGGTAYCDVRNFRVDTAVTALVMDATAPGFTNANKIGPGLLRTSAASAGTVASLAFGPVSGNEFYSIDASNYGSGAAKSWNVAAGNYGNTWYGGYIDTNANNTGFTLASGVRGISVFGMINQATTQVTDAGGNSPFFQFYNGSGAGKVVVHAGGISSSGISNESVDLTSSKDASDSGTDFTLTTGATRSAGNIFRISNNGTKVNVDYFGGLQIAGGYDVTSGDIYLGTGVATGVHLGRASTTTTIDGDVKMTSTKNVGTCTLNGGSPSTCTATVLTGAKCVAVPQGTTAVAATHTVATSVTTTTLTVTGANGLTDVVTYFCGG